MSVAKALKTLKFEEAMERFEAIVEKLEDGKVPLEASLKYFEEGMQLSQYCQQKLKEAEGRIKVLMGKPLEEVEIDRLDELGDRRECP